MSGRRSMRLSPRQAHVLFVLSGPEGALPAPGGYFYPLRDEQARAVIRALYERGLVDVAGWKGNARTYRITQPGRDALAAAYPDPDGFDGLLEDE